MSTTAGSCSTTSAIPRENLLNRYGDVDPDGTYVSSIDSANRRFFTMIGTLVRGRVTVGGCAAAASRVALTIATRYALTRRQFSRPDGGEVLLMDYLVHQRRLLPLIARAYAYGFAQNELVRKMQRVQTAENPDTVDQRELESLAAGLKVAQTAFATRAIQECREACGGAGYLSENRLVQLKADTDVFTTFEGDNQILTQLVAKELLTGYADEVRGMSPWEWAGFARETVSDVVKKYAFAEQLLQMISDRGIDSEEEGSLYNRGTQMGMLREREEYLVSTAARRMQAAMKRENDAFDAFNFVSDHIMNAARAHIDRLGSRIVRRRHRQLRRRRRQAHPQRSVRSFRAVRDRRRPGVVHRASALVRRAREGRCPCVQRAMPRSAPTRRGDRRRSRGTGPAGGSGHRRRRVRIGPRQCEERQTEFVG